MVAASSTTRTKSSRAQLAAASVMAPPAAPAPTLSKRSRSSDEEKPRTRKSKALKPDKLPKERNRKEKKGKGRDAAAAAAASVQPPEPNGPYRKAMYSAFLNDAFDKRYRGDNSSYNEIISQFRALLPSSARAAAPPEPSSSTTQPRPQQPLVQLRTWLDALTSVVSKLDQSHEPLVETILSVPWATTEDAFVHAYLRFVGALVSARTEWLKVVLDKCVRGFKYRSAYTLASPAALPHLTRRLIYDRIHDLLRLLLALVPTLSPSLAPVLALHFPSKREPRPAQICYIDNLLHLTEYCTALCEDVLTLVVERALNIDVEIQGDPEDWEEIEDELEARRDAELNERRIAKLDDLKAAVRDLVDRPMAHDQTHDGSDSDDDDDDDDSDDGDESGLDLENLSSDDDDEPEPINDEDAVRLARKGNAKMSEAAIRKVLENRSKLDGILRVVLDHLAAAHGDDRSRTLATATTNGTTPVLKFGELSSAKEFPFDFRDPASRTATSTPCGSKEPTPTPEDVKQQTTTTTTTTTRRTFSDEQLERQTTLFRTLLDIFDRTLLRTFKTRNVQFILFYLCSRDATSSDHFVGVLLGRALFDLDAPVVTRVAAAGYVASFVARAKFVDQDMTRKVVRHLCQYLEGQMDDFARFGRTTGGGGAGTTRLANQAGGGGGGGQELPVFYAVSQAVFYVFCFRWRDLLDDEEDVDDEVGLLGLDVGRKWIMGLETLKKAVSSSFNPLKVCAQPVVAQFASIAHKTGFMYCYSILDSNRRSASAFSHPRDNANNAPPAPPPPPLPRAPAAAAARANGNGSGPSLPTIPPLRSVSTSSLLTTLAANHLSLGGGGGESSPSCSSSGTTTPVTTTTPATATATPSTSRSSSFAAPRQLLVAEEMDSFFPFDPFKLALSSVYIADIYRDWEDDDDDDEDEDETTDSDDDDDSSTDASTSSRAGASSSDISEDEGANKSWASSAGLAVPGTQHGRGGGGIRRDDDNDDDEEDEVARSFEAMSISFSPDHASFGGRRGGPFARR